MSGVSIRITESTVWRQPWIILSILLHPKQLVWDCIIRNERVFVASENGETAAYCVVADQGKFQQLMAVLTFSKFRERGHASRVIKRAIARCSLKPVYVICRREVVMFYERFGFTQAHKPPSFLRSRAAWFNGTLGWLLGREHVVLRLRPKLG